MKSALIRMREIEEFSSNTEKTIIKYIIKNPGKVIEYSIHELAIKTYSSPATILRLCKKIGFSGYREFRMAISYELAMQEKSYSEEKKEITKLDNIHEIVEKITYKNIISIEDTKKLMDFQTLEKIVDLIYRSKMISLFGIGSSLYVARDAYLKFLRLGKSCSVNEDWHSQLVQARNMKKEDLGIVISYSGQTVEMIECMKAMRENETPIVSITRYGASPIGDMSTYSLYVAANESIFRSGAMSSRISQLNIIDILYTAYANKTYDYSLDRLSKTHIYKPNISK